MTRIILWLTVSLFAAAGFSAACGPTDVPSSETTQETTKPDGSTNPEPSTPDASPTEQPTEKKPSPEPSSEPSPEPPTVPDTQPVETQADTPTNPDAPAPGPINAKPGQWTWIDVPESKCGYGTPTGFGVNPSTNPDAKRVFIYMQGGGACWAASGLIGSCFGARPSATNLSGYGKTRFQNEGDIKRFLFNRNEANNVFKDDHMIYIPHCTGDVYAGNSQLKNSSGKTMYFHGHKNMRAFLSRIAATFTKVKEVYISGSSAGGFGSSMNWWLAQEYFGNIKVHLLNDSGPPFDPKPGRYETWVKAWKLVTPTGCTDCDKSISNILTHYEKIFLAKGHKMGFLSYDRDQVIRLFFNHLDLKGDDFKADLYTLYDRLDKTQNTHYFGMAGTSHTMMGGAKTLSNKSGVVLGDWIKWMVEDDPKWKSYRQ